MLDVFGHIACFDTIISIKTTIAGIISNTCILLFLRITINVGYYML